MPKERNLKKVEKTDENKSLWLCWQMIHSQSLLSQVGQSDNPGKRGALERCI